MYNKMAKLTLLFSKGLNLLRPILELAVRLWVAKVFFMSGLTKIQSWQSTLELFAWEYQVPLLNPEVAAYLATGAELALPILLIVGFATRYAAIALFVLNAVALISYPDMSPAGEAQHYLWGLMMLITVFYGAGKLSIDHVLKIKFMRN